METTHELLCLHKLFGAVKYHDHQTFYLNRYFVSERRDRVVNAPASYSGSPGFKFRPRDLLS
jgi:hypothetical protein